MHEPGKNIAKALAEPANTKKFGALSVAFASSPATAA